MGDSKARLMSLFALIWSVVHDFVELPLIALVGWLWVKHPIFHIPLIGLGVIVIFLIGGFVSREIKKAKRKSTVKTLEERVAELEAEIKKLESK